MAKHFYTCPGSCEHKQRHLEFRDGHEVVVEDGSFDQREYINSFTNACDIKVLIARYQAGDPTALSARQGFYGDISGLPNNLADIQRAMSDSRSAFDSLPEDYKALFGGDFRNWVSSMDKPGFFQKLHDTLVPPAEPAAETVKE